MDTTITTPRGTVTIRAAREEDAPAYRDLRLEALRNHPEAFSSDYAANLAKPMTFWTERLRSDSTDSTVMTYFAVHDQQLIGMCGITHTDSPKIRHSANIVGMYVRPDWRGFRIAEGLITICMDWARTQGVKIVKLAVVTTNTRAIRCYARCGFQVYGIEPQALYYDGVFYDELLMTRAI
ncbi:MAG: GNAT family N-acetyltransferase [Anaerolineae bacterium]|nr:GNAT family N-acetyltransferase [Anaerolineae bacterium]